MGTSREGRGPLITTREGQKNRSGERDKHFQKLKTQPLVILCYLLEFVTLFSNKLFNQS